MKGKNSDNRYSKECPLVKVSSEKIDTSTSAVPGCLTKHGYCFYKM